MKRINNFIILWAVLATALISCRDNERGYIFDKSPETRIQEALEVYRKKLIAPENGWITHYTPNENTGSFIFLFDFDKDGSVRIKSDFILGKLQTSTASYRVEKTVLPGIIIETHSVLHQLFGVGNNGINAEFEFEFVEAGDDKIVLSSKTDVGREVSKLVLKRATKADWDLDAYGVIEQNIIAKRKSFFRTLSLPDGTKVGMDYPNYDPLLRTFILSYLDEDGRTVLSKTARLEIRKNGFCFLAPVVIGESALTCFTYNTQKGLFVADMGHGEVDGMEIKYPNSPATPYMDYKKMGTVSGTNSFLFIEGFDDYKKGFRTPCSEKFLEFYDKINEDLARDEVYIYYYFPVSYLHIPPPWCDITLFHLQNRNAVARVIFEFEKLETKEDKIILENIMYIYKLGSTPTGKSGDALVPLLEPLREFSFQPEGFYVKELSETTPFSHARGGSYSNRTWLFISGKDASLWFYLVSE